VVDTQWDLVGGTALVGSPCRNRGHPKHGEKLHHPESKEAAGVPKQSGGRFMAKVLPPCGGVFLHLRSSIGWRGTEGLGKGIPPAFEGLNLWGKVGFCWSKSQKELPHGGAFPAGRIRQ